jgi:hypothetical protein
MHTLHFPVAGMLYSRVTTYSSVRQHCFADFVTGRKRKRCLDSPDAVLQPVNDSGQRTEFESGMVRDTNDGKTLVHLVYVGPMLLLWAVQLTAGARKYAVRNWMKAEGKLEWERFRESAARQVLKLAQADPGGRSTPQTPLRFPY